MIEGPRRRPLHIPADLLHVLGREPAKTPQTVLVEDLLNRNLTGTESKATHAQLSAALVLFAIHLEDMIEAKAKQKHRLQPHLHPILDEFSKDVQKTRKALTLLYLNKTTGLPIEKYRRRWKEKTWEYDRLLREVRQEEIDDKKSAIIKRATLITQQEREEITKIALWKMHRPLHRKTISAIREPDPKKRRDEREKYATALKLTVPTAVLAHLFMLGGAAYETADPHMDYGHLTDWKTLLVVLGSFAAKYMSIKFNSNAQYQTLENPHIRTSPSIATKSAHGLVDNVSPENSKLKKRAIWATTVFPYLWEDILLVVGSLFPEAIAAAVGVNAGAAAANLAEGGILYSYDRKVKNKMNQRRQEKVKRPKPPRQDAN